MRTLNYESIAAAEAAAVTAAQIPEEAAAATQQGGRRRAHGDTRGFSTRIRAAGLAAGLDQQRQRLRGELTCLLARERACGLSWAKARKR
jgi:hypothetical protein